MGIFDNRVSVFTRYAATLVMRDRLMGGIPQDPKLIQAWLRSKAGIKDEQEVLAATVRTLRELGADVPESASYEQIVAASESLASELHTNGFKRNQDGLYLEGRQIKAMLKENTNILLSGKRLKTGGSTAKGIELEKSARSVVAERVHVAESVISLGREEPDGTHLFVGHTEDRTGPHSNLTMYQYVEKATVQFTVKVLEPCLSEDQWAQIWVLAQESGLGALRSQGHGRFDIVSWDKL